MNRHPEFQYRIKKYDSKDGWIYISDVESDSWEQDLFEMSYEGPIEFILRIKDKTHWTVRKDEQGIYYFEEDPLSLKFWWDDLFGFTIVIKDRSKLSSVIEFLADYVINIEGEEAL